MKMKKVIRNCKKNPWIVSTFVMGILFVVFVAVIFSDNIDYSKKELTTTETLISCLADKGVKIYGAKWCGYTKQFINEAIGGFDVAAPIYVECTENAEECSTAGIRGYPTTKINGAPYSGDRTLQGLAQATGCKASGSVESVKTQVASLSTTGGCGA